jgi:hypothetical protein
MPGTALKPGDSAQVLQKTTTAATIVSSDEIWLPKGSDGLVITLVCTAQAGGQIDTLTLDELIPSDTGVYQPTFSILFTFAAIALNAAGVKKFVIRPGVITGSYDGFVNSGVPNRFRISVTPHDGNSITWSVRVQATK